MNAAGIFRYNFIPTSIIVQSFFNLSSIYRIEHTFNQNCRKSGYRISWHGAKPLAIVVLKCVMD
jgi:hypothetical protein